MAVSFEARMAFRNVFRQRRRSVILGSAIALVMALFTLLDGLATGVRETMFDTATTLLTGHLNVGGFYKASASQAVPAVTAFGDIEAVVKRAVPETAYVVARGRGWGKVVSDRTSLSLSVAGVDLAREPGLAKALRITSGRLEDLSHGNTILLFERQARKLDVRLGDVVTLVAPNVRGAMNAVDCRVAAIAADIGLLSDWTTFVNNETLRGVYQLRANATGAIQIYLRPESLEELPRITIRLREALVAAGYRLLEPTHQPFWTRLDGVSREDWVGQRLDLTTWQDELAYISGTLTTFRGFTTLVMSVLLILVVTGMTNTMWIAIRERTREIGTLRALGMERMSVMRLFVLESVILGLLGAAAGAALGSLVLAVLNVARLGVPASWQLFLLADHLHLSLRPGAVLSAVAILAAVVALGAVLPASRAARLRPVIALSRR